MAYTVTIKPDLQDVVLPNGGRYQGGDEVVLSDEHYSVIPASTRAAVFSAEAVVTVPAT